jgi:transposase
MARHGKELTTEQKEMLLSLSHQGFSSYKIQEFTGINCRTIDKFLKRTRERGSIENNPRSGGRKKTIPRDEQVLFRSVKRNQRQTLKDLTARFNNRTGYNVSEITVPRRLCYFGGYKRRMIWMQENYNITCKS